jgi:hypothetical protein
VVTVTCTTFIIRGEEWTHTTGMFVGRYRKIEEVCNEVMHLGRMFSG